MNRRLATGLILPILIYGADLVTPNAFSLGKMTILWTKVLIWVTNCFYLTPVSILPCEACLPPPNSRLPHKRKVVAFKMAHSSPLITPAAARMPATFPGHSRKRATDFLWTLLAGLKQNYIPLACDQHRPVPAVRSHLPIDALRPLVAIATFLHLLHPHLLPVNEGPPSDPSWGRSYSALKSTVKWELLLEWLLRFPPPLSYPYLSTLIPHPFIGMDKCTAGRIHQMQAGKSYLAAHPNCGDTDPEKTCLTCGNEEKTFEHVIAPALQLYSPTESPSPP